jgi:DNA polymerase I-like protein with 3'-5' exonuclease and polymerase domains
MATVETVHKLIAKTEVPSKGADGTAKNDGTTDLPYAQLALRKVRQMRDNWLKGAPEFERGWEREIQTYRDNGFIAEEITGRRRDFLDGEAPNEIVNFPIQASAAGLMNLAIVQLHEQIPLHKWGTGTGIINQCHDSIVIECPESEGENVARMLEEAMNQVHPALPGVVFSAGADIGKDWKKVG